MEENNMIPQEQETAMPEEESAAPAAAETEAEVAEPKHTGFLGKVDKFFGVTAAGSNFKAEMIAGLTTFMAMVYILMVNAGMFSEPWVGLSYGAAYIATAIGAIAGTMLMAFLAKMPLAQASGMGINAFIVYTLLLSYSGLTYANCMVFTLIDGVIFLILTATGLRKKIFEAIPKAVRHAIPVGIGLFIAFIGMQNAGIIVDEGSTLVTFVSFNVLADGFSYGAIIAPLVAILGVIAIAIMSKKNVKGAILWGILGTAVLYYALAGLGCAWSDAACLGIFEQIGATFSFNPFSAFGDWGTQAVGQVFVEGFVFNMEPGALIIVLLTSALSLCMIDMFDTIGTLYGACSKGNLLDENGTPIRMERMMLADSIATCVGAVAGTSTVTTFVESSAGVAAGGKTGLTAFTTGALFFLAMFLSPIAQLIPGAATATALIWVGVLMLTSVTNIDWTDAAEAIVGFLTFIVMLLGYSIAKGIGIGIVAYIIVMLCTGKIKEITIPTYVIGALFLLTFIFT
ncbi:MAG: NCS2 family permease [Clostridia bacterium]|nr:NCS2 family permease [Clostridia bacterium]